MRDKAEELSLGKTTEAELKADPVLQDVLVTIDKENALKDTMRTFTNISSEIGDVRAVSCCEFQPTPKPSLLATGSWTGSCKIWNASTMKESLVFTGWFTQIRFARILAHFYYVGHTDRLTDLSFHPKSGNGQSPSAVNIATCSADCSIKLWSLERFEVHGIVV